MDKHEAKKQVVEAGKELHREGLIVRTWGNVSCRIDEETFVITPSGRDYLNTCEEDIVEIKIKDGSYEGDTKPSSERRVHGAIYAMKPDVKFIIHTHQEQASIISAMNIKSFKPSVEFESILGKAVLCAEYALPGTMSLCKKTAKVVSKSDGKAVILKNHGAVCMGEDYSEAFKVSSILEKACETFLYSSVGSFRAESNLDQNSWDKTLSTLPKEMTYILNKETETLKFSLLGKNLPSYIDDFAQLVGARVTVRQACDKQGILNELKQAAAVIIEGGGILCQGKDEEEAESVSMLVSKNCKAYFAAYVMGKPKPINRAEALYMRQIYLKKYSKMK